MYSPKIREDLIPVLYHLGKEQGKPMTKVVDDIIRGYITLRKQNGGLRQEELLERLVDYAMEKFDQNVYKTNND